MRNKGFTFVELITVVVILGILAVYAAPRIFTAQGDDVAAAEVALISLLRLQQQRAMQDTEFAFEYGVRAVQNGDVLELTPVGPSVGSAQQVSFSGVSLTAPGEEFTFDALGRVDSLGIQSYEFILTGQQTRTVCINSQGFISSRRCEQG